MAIKPDAVFALAPALAAYAKITVPMTTFVLPQVYNIDKDIDSTGLNQWGMGKLTRDAFTSQTINLYIAVVLWAWERAAGQGKSRSSKLRVLRFRPSKARSCSLRSPASELEPEKSTRRVRCDQQSILSACGVGSPKEVLLSTLGQPVGQ